MDMKIVKEEPLLLSSLGDISSFDHGGSGFDDPILSVPISEAHSTNTYRLDQCLSSPLSDGPHVVSLMRDEKPEFIIVKDEPCLPSRIFSGDDMSLNENIKLESSCHTYLPGIDQTGALFGEASSEGIDWGMADGDEDSVDADDFVDSSDDDVILIEEQRSFKRDPDDRSSRFTCTYSNCNKTFQSKTGLRLHQRQHSGKYPFTCDVCGKGFSGRSQLFEHTRSHTGKYPKCRICGVAPKSAQGRRIHAAMHATERHTCKTCSKVFSCSDYLRRHEKTHTRSFTCSICDKVFLAKHHVTEHERTHFAATFHCELCDFKTTFKQSLKRHVKSKHGARNEKKETICTRCGGCFTSEKQYKRHSDKCHLTQDIWSQDDAKDAP